MAHNFRNRTYGDGYTSIDNGYIIDGRLKYDMASKLQNNIAFFSGRTDVEPVPEAAKKSETDLAGVHCCIFKTAGVQKPEDYGNHLQGPHETL